MPESHKSNQEPVTRPGRHLYASQGISSSVSDTFKLLSEKLVELFKKTHPKIIHEVIGLKEGII